MAYRMADHGQAAVDGPSKSVRNSVFSKWWPAGFFLFTIVLIIVGGGLTGAWYASFGDYDWGNDGLYYGGVACFALAGVCKFTGWFLVILYCLRRRRSRSAPTASATLITFPPPPCQDRTTCNTPLHEQRIGLQSIAVK
ncbi:hypothetical protein AAL_03854 [Moelleriella libera RCEF 2490]|uniref:Uncharacterized protein n=1 Tax=Moelleriella libera RCEF 2490 TaxID=1081109 RepID=A0A168CHX1_9HYPO|nr:hypothetical protein AAL_03854 [Moelleriella libera RCEF 2490]